MQAEEEFRSRLREDLRGRPAPAVGTLAADAFTTGRRMRRRQRTLRAVSGTAAVVAVAVGSVAMAGAFGSNSPSAGGVAPGVGTKTSRSAPPPSWPRTPVHSGPTAPTGPTSSAPGPTVTIPPGWTVPPPAAVTDPEWVTSRAVIAETKKLLPAGTDSSAYTGDYAYAGGDPRQQWAVDASMTITTAKGSAQLGVTLHAGDGSSTSGTGCRGESSCGSKLLPDGSRVILQHDWDPMDTGKLGAFVMVIRKDGMSVQVTVRDQSQLTDDQLFAVASSGAWGGLKMDKSFVDQAEATIKGTFMNPPA